MEGERKGKREEGKEILRGDKSSLELNSWLCVRGGVTNTQVHTTYMKVTRYLISSKH